MQSLKDTSRKNNHRLKPYLFNALHDWDIWPSKSIQVWDLYFVTGIQRDAQLRNIQFKLEQQKQFFFQFNSVFFCKQNVTQVFDNIFFLGESSNFRFVTCCELSEIHLIYRENNKTRSSGVELKKTSLYKW